MISKLPASSENRTIYPKKKDRLIIANVKAISSYVTSQLSLTELCLIEQFQI